MSGIFFEKVKFASILMGWMPVLNRNCEEKTCGDCPFKGFACQVSFGCWIFDPLVCGMVDGADRTSFRMSREAGLKIHACCCRHG
jgi:hypothetical protein